MGSYRATTTHCSFSQEEGGSHDEDRHVLDGVGQDSHPVISLALADEIECIKTKEDIKWNNSKGFENMISTSSTKQHHCISTGKTY